VFKDSDWGTFFRKSRRNTRFEGILVAKNEGSTPSKGTRKNKQYVYRARLQFRANALRVNSHQPGRLFTRP
jgi:hypothetical protein